MDCVGRMAEIFLCILCLTLVPAGSILQICSQQQQNRIELQTDELYGRINQKKSLTRADYEHFKEVFAICKDYDFELMAARRYVMPAASMGGTDIQTPRMDGAESVKTGLPVKILYRMELEEEFLIREEIDLEGYFINISVCGKNGYFYTCGGEVW